MTPAPSRIVGAATAPCPHRYRQDEVLAAIAPRFAGAIDVDRYRSIFANCGVETRRFVRPLEALLESRGWLLENDRFIAEGTRLGAEALRSALAVAEIAPEAIDHLFFVTSTGIAAPSLDARLIGGGCGRPDTRRSPLWGLGCAGGASALGRASEWLSGHPRGVAAVVCVEFCSQTYLPGDRSLENFVASALFGDGVAAAVLVGHDHRSTAPALEIVGTRVTLFPDSTDVMGWTPVAEGLQVVFDRRIPELARKHAGLELAQLAEGSGVDPERVTQFWGHPGGPRVLDAYAESLGWPESRFELSRTVLREEGNMSSATVLHLLARVFAEGREIDEDEFALCTALGPGFTAEQLLLAGKQ